MKSPFALLVRFLLARFFKFNLITYVLHVYVG